MQCICGKPGNYIDRVGQVLCPECDALDQRVNQETIKSCRKQMRDIAIGRALTARAKNKQSGPGSKRISHSESKEVRNLEELAC